MTDQMDRTCITRGAFHGRSQDPRAVAQRRGRRRRDVLERHLVAGVPKTPLEPDAQVIEVVVAGELAEAEHTGDEIDAVRGSAHRSEAWAMTGSSEKRDVGHELEVEANLGGVQ